MPQQVYFRTPRHTRPELPLFVFLPGMDGSGKLLQVQTEGLEKGFDIRCLAIPPDDLASWEELAEQVVALVRTELDGDYERSVYLCGESFGGCLAMKVALRSHSTSKGNVPPLFHRIILVNPASSLNRRSWIRWGSELTDLLPSPLYRLSCIGLLPFLAALERIRDSDRQALIGAMMAVTPSTSNWRLSLLRNFYMADEQLQQITQPVMIVASGSDRLLPSIAEAQHLSGILSNAQIHILPFSGHACLLETDVNLYEILNISGFLKIPIQACLQSSTAG
jgi:pimeloyl-ACP methyl ester carboxylesterase